MWYGTLSIEGEKIEFGNYVFFLVKKSIIDRAVGPVVGAEGQSLTQILIEIEEKTFLFKRSSTYPRVYIIAGLTK